MCFRSLINLTSPLAGWWQNSIAPTTCCHGIPNIFHSHPQSIFLPSGGPFISSAKDVSLSFTFNKTYPFRFLPDADADVRCRRRREGFACHFSYFVCALTPVGWRLSFYLGSSSRKRKEVGRRASNAVGIKGAMLVKSLFSSWIGNKGAFRRRRMAGKQKWHNLHTVEFSFSLPCSSARRFALSMFTQWLSRGWGVVLLCDCLEWGERGKGKHFRYAGIDFGDT